MERKDAHHLLLDIVFAQEAEPSGLSSPLQVYLFDSDSPVTAFRQGGKVLDLQTSNPFPSSVGQNQISSYLNRSLALSLGTVSMQGFHVGFSYTGTCVFVVSIRLFYRRCPGSVQDLVRFEGLGAGSGPQRGSCVEGATEVFQPVRQCRMDGTWGPQRGGCDCRPGHELSGDTCQACRMGHYKAANESGGCRVCPPNSRTHGEAAETCDCLQGFGRLTSDPYYLGCTKPPSAPVDVTVRRHNDSALTLLWEPPHDRGGREEVTYDIKCLEKEAEAAVAWGRCGEEVVLVSEGLGRTVVSIMGLNPQHNYMFSVQAWNALSTQQGASLSSSASVTIHRLKVPVIVTSNPTEVTPFPQHRRSVWLMASVIVLCGGLLVFIVISVAVCTLRPTFTRLRCEQEVELLPMNPGIPFRRHEGLESLQTNDADSVLQLLEGLGPRLLDSLKEVLVERNTLTLGKELGKGEFGSVYEGVFTPQEGLDMKVAVKTMRVGIHSQADLHDFLTEAETMKHFDHVNVVKLLGVTVQREQDSPLPVPLVILPFMKHGDLRRFLIATRYGDIPMFVPVQTLLRFMVDISAGMEYLSSVGLLHRDLAARNCMLGDNLRVCVADFGLSKQSSDYYRQRVSIRVPIKWMAIESVSESIYTTKTDVWSFGVTMWEIMSGGRTPYPGVHNQEVLDLLLSGHRLKQPEDCDHRVYAVMRTCWDQDPARRPDFRDLGKTLKGLLSELPVLEPSLEVCYINQGLEAAASALPLDPHIDFEEKLGNVYLPAPMGAGACKDEDEEEEEGYLLFIKSDSGVKGDDNL
ncbi:tyrosine-protein kinase receptor TYRO3 isoform X2 [Genypterus blacodes]